MRGAILLLCVVLAAACSRHQAARSCAIAGKYQGLDGKRGEVILLVRNTGEFTLSLRHFGIDLTEVLSTGSVQCFDGTSGRVVETWNGGRPVERRVALDGCGLLWPVDEDGRSLHLR